MNSWRNRHTHLCNYSISCACFSGGWSYPPQPSCVLFSQLPRPTQSSQPKHPLSVPRSFPQLPEFVLPHDGNEPELLRLHGPHAGHDWHYSKWGYLCFLFFFNCSIQFSSMNWIDWLLIISHYSQIRLKMQNCNESSFILKLWGFEVTDTARAKIEVLLYIYLFDMKKIKWNRKAIFESRCRFPASEHSTKTAPHC